MTNHDASPTKLTGRRIRDERRRLNWTQQRLANEAGVSLASIQRAEKDAAEMDGKVLSRISQALNLGGQPLSAPSSTAVEKGATVPSTLAQMVGTMQVPVTAADPYLVLVELAVERKDPPEVFEKLAQARRNAPPGSDYAYWLRLYMSAVDEAKAARKTGRA